MILLHLSCCALPVSIPHRKGQVVGLCEQEINDDVFWLQRETFPVQCMFLSIAAPLFCYPLALNIPFPNPMQRNIFVFQNASSQYQVSFSYVCSRCKVNCSSPTRNINFLLSMPDQPILSYFCSKYQFNLPLPYFYSQYEANLSFFLFLLSPYATFKCYSEISFGSVLESNVWQKLISSYLACFIFVLQVLNLWRTMSPAKPKQPINFPLACFLSHSFLTFFFNYFFTLFGSSYHQKTVQCLYGTGKVSCAMKWQLPTVVLIVVFRHFCFVPLL